MAETAAKTAGGETLYCSTLDATEGETLEKIYKFSDNMAATKETDQVYHSHFSVFLYLLDPSILAFFADSMPRISRA